MYLYTFLLSNNCSHGRAGDRGGVGAPATQTPPRGGEEDEAQQPPQPPLPPQFQETLHGPLVFISFFYLINNYLIFLFNAIKNLRKPRLEQL